MKKYLLLCILVLNFSITAQASNFTLCKNKFALCTTAQCKEVPGKEGMVSCHCSVQKGFSVGTESCSDLKKTSTASNIKSRYFPIKTYAICKNDRPWAWCLDSPCTVDKKDPSKAKCLCSVVRNKGPYLIVTKKYTKNTCTTGLYSSATVGGAAEITQFLKDHQELPPFPTKVLNRQ